MYQVYQKDGRYIYKEITSDDDYELNGHDTKEEAKQFADTYDTIGECKLLCSFYNKYANVLKHIENTKPINPFFIEKYHDIYSDFKNHVLLIAIMTEGK